MKRSTFPFESLHDYLEDQLGHLSRVTDSMVKEAKERYRTLYQKWYKEQYKLRFVQLSFSVTKQDKKELLSNANIKGLSIGKYLKFLLNQSNVKNRHQNQYGAVEIMKLIDFIEGSIYEQHPVDLKEVLVKLENIKNALR